MLLCLGNEVLDAEVWLLLPQVWIQVTFGGEAGVFAPQLTQRICCSICTARRIAAMKQLIHHGMTYLQGSHLVYMQP